MRTLFLTTAAFAVLVMVAPVGNAHAAPLPCPDDGRLKGVEIGSPLPADCLRAAWARLCHERAEWCVCCQARWVEKNRKVKIETRGVPLVAA
jgi:hypothetical protein